MQNKDSAGIRVIFWADIKQCVHDCWIDQGLRCHKASRFARPQDFINSHNDDNNNNNNDFMMMYIRRLYYH